MHKLCKVKTIIFFPDTCLTFSKILDISLTAVKIPDISRFSIQVVTVIYTVDIALPLYNYQLIFSHPHVIIPSRPKPK